MSITLSNPAAIGALRALTQTQNNQSRTMQRLNTGFRINSGYDDPAGLIALEYLRGEQAAVGAATTNANRANSMMTVAESSMAEINDLLVDVKGMALEVANDAGLSDSEKQAKQMQIDMAIEAIDRIVHSAEFNGQRLLDGSLGITTTGVDASKLTDVNLTGRPSNSQTVSLDVDVVAAAEKGKVSFTGAGTGASAVDLVIQGRTGSVEMSFAGSTTVAQMAALINQNTDVTGVTASASAGKLTFLSEEYGDDSFVSVETTSGTFALDGGVTRDDGADAEVTVNGQTAGTDGLTLTFNTGGVAGSVTMSESFASTAGSSEQFNVSGGGATFAFGADGGDKATVGISSLASHNLGIGDVGYLNSLKSGGSNSVLNDPQAAVRIAEEASGQVARMRGRIGGFQKYTIESQLNYLADTSTALGSAISQIGDTDYAVEMSKLQRENILLQAQMGSLQLINQNTSSVLSLLGGM